MPFEKLLVVDDEMAVRRALKSLLNRRRLTVATAESIEEARGYVGRDTFDLVFLDLRLPDGEGTDFLKELRQHPEAPTVVMMTGYGSIESAVQCMRLGAFDYLIKPFSNDQIDIVVRKAEDYLHMVKVASYFSRPEDEGDGQRLLGESPATHVVRTLIQRVAPTQATVLIHGESGTGKELVAAEIHRASQRRDKPFIRVNCAAIAETLIESEFFGHERGAFTGAVKRKEGRFELAHGGTILLDEISEVSPGLQAKLLRVLQEQEFERVGGTNTIKVDVRVIATTNRNLEAFAKEGRFREDLFYRLNVFPIHNPPLRERPEDIPVLARVFLERLSRKHGGRARAFTSDALDALWKHPWPGNVRELHNTIERAVITAGNEEQINAAILGLPGQAPAKVSDAKPALLTPVLHPDDITPLDAVEKAHILNALSACQGNRTHAARHLGISLRTLRNKLALYRLEPNSAVLKS